MADMCTQPILTFHWGVVLAIIIIFIILDKSITLANIKAVQKNFPKVKDPLSIEKNPVAKFFFQKFGLVGGSILFGIVSFFLALIFMALVWFALQFFWPQTALSMSFYVLCLVYGFTIVNNLFFLLKFSKLIP